MEKPTISLLIFRLLLIPISSTKRLISYNYAEMVVYKFMIHLTGRYAKVIKMTKLSVEKKMTKKYVCRWTV